MKRIHLNKDLVAGMILIGIVIILAGISLFYTPYDPEAMDIANKLAPPSASHLLGTDQFGRDTLSRIMSGSQIVLLVGAGSVFFSFLLGSLLGILAGYYGGIVDECIMKLIELKMAFPGTLLALMLISIWSPSLWIIILALSIMNTPRFTRVIRSGYLQYNNALFIDAAKVIGLSPLRIMLVHIFPNLLSSIYVTAALSFSSAILSEAGLSYLGLGIQPPLASWGKMLSEAQPYMLQSPLLALIPGIMITLIVLGFNLLADGLSKLQN